MTPNSTYELPSSSPPAICARPRKGRVASVKSIPRVLRSKSEGSRFFCLAGRLSKNSCCFRWRIVSTSRPTRKRIARFAPHIEPRRPTGAFATNPYTPAALLIRSPAREKPAETLISGPFLPLYPVQLAVLVPCFGTSLPLPWDSCGLCPGVDCETSQWGSGSKYTGERFEWGSTKVARFGNKIACNGMNPHRV